MTSPTVAAANVAAASGSRSTEKVAPEIRLAGKGKVTVEIVELVDRSLSHFGQLEVVSASTMHCVTYSLLSLGFRGEVILIVLKRVRGKSAQEGRGWRRPIVKT